MNHYWFEARTIHKKNYRCDDLVCRTLDEISKQKHWLGLAHSTRNHYQHFLGNYVGERHEAGNLGFSGVFANFQEMCRWISNARASACIKQRKFNFIIAAKSLLRCTFSHLSVVLRNLSRSLYFPFQNQHVLNVKVSPRMRRRDQ